MEKAENKEGLEENRIIYVNGAFNEEMTKNLFEKIVSLEIKNPSKDILLIIDSYGGSCHSYLAIKDLIDLTRCDVATLTIGKAMSCGQLLLMSGAEGKRFASKHSRILVHEVSAFTFGKLTDMEIDVNEGKEIQRIIEEIIGEKTNLSKQRIKKLMERDSFLSAYEAKELGLIDHVVETHKDIYKRINL